MMVSAKVRGTLTNGAFLVLGHDSRGYATQGRRPEQGDASATLGHHRSHLEVELTASAAHQASPEYGLGVDLAGQVDREGVVYGDHVVVEGGGGGFGDVVDIKLLDEGVFVGVVELLVGRPEQGTEDGLVLVEASSGPR